MLYGDGDVRGGGGSCGAGAALKRQTQVEEAIVRSGLLLASRRLPAELPLRSVSARTGLFQRGVTLGGVVISF